MSIKIKQYCLSLWTIFDPLYFRLTRLHHIENKSGDKTIIRIRLTRYKGRKLILADGTVIDKNDLLLKIHLHNVKLLRQIQGLSEMRKALILYRSVQESLPYISRYLQTHDYANHIKGLIGITMLYKGCRKLGFETFPIQNQYYKIFKQVAHSPIYLLSTNKAFNKEYPTPMYLLMSKNRLLNHSTFSPIMRSNDAPF